MLNSHSEILRGDSGSGNLAAAGDTILVTGANGFVGSQVVRTLLGLGFERIRCLVRQSSHADKLAVWARPGGQAPLEIVTGSLLSRDTCRRAVEAVSVVYHLAAGTGKSYPDCFLNSAVATRNLLDEVVRQKTLKRFVNVSSIAVYSGADIPAGGVLDESSPIERNLVERGEAYVYGKVKQDEIVLEYSARKGLPYVIVRPSVVFGPGKAKITDRVGSDTFGVFLHLGLGNTIPLTYIDNCADAIVLAGLKKGIEGQVFNIVDDDLPRSRAFLKRYKQKVRWFPSLPVPRGLWFLFCAFWENYAKRSEGQLPPVFNKRVFDVYWKGNAYSNRKAKDLLGWAPKVSMQDALERFFRYMREAKHQP